MEFFQALEQAMAAQRDLAELLGNYKKELLGHGFSAQEALLIVIDYQRSLMNGAKS